MLKRTFVRCFAAFMLLSAIATQAYAQRELHHIPPVVDPDGYNPDLLQPFVEPFMFEPDFQFFAPADADFLDSEIESRVGWFSTYDRGYIYVTRPQAEPSRVQGDYTWGNRMDLGYMTEEDHGWLVSIHHVDGPNVYHILEAERINVVEGRDQVNVPPGTVVFRGTAAAGGAAGAVVPGLPIRDRDDPVTDQRDYRLHDSLNVAKLNSFEINKTFRLPQRHYGSVIEPFVGFRYFNFEDFFQRDTYSRFDLTTGALIYTTAAFGFFPPPPVANVGIERYDSFTSRFENHMFGGQMGLRWYKQKSRWNLSSEVRAFAVQNFQSLDTTFNSEQTVYNGGAPASTVQIVLYNRQHNSANASEFVFGTEVRAEAAYELTRYIQLRAGMTFMDFARGLGRGNDIVQNSQDAILVGATFGVNINH